MMVVSRKIDERIVIGGDGTTPLVEVQVVAIGRDKVRLGITAPREIPVDREEVHLRKVAESNAA